MYDIERYNTPNLPTDYYVTFEGRKITNPTPHYDSAEFMRDVCEEHQVTEYSTFQDLCRIDREGKNSA